MEEASCIANVSRLLQNTVAAIREGKAPRLPQQRGCQQAGPNCTVLWGATYACERKKEHLKETEVTLETLPGPWSLARKPSPSCTTAGCMLERNHSCALRRAVV